MAKGISVFKKAVKMFPNASPYVAGDGLYGAIIEWGRRVIVVTADDGKIQVGNYVRKDWFDGGEPFMYSEERTIKSALALVDAWTGGDWVR